MKLLMSLFLALSLSNLAMAADDCKTFHKDTWKQAKTDYLKLLKSNIQNALISAYARADLKITAKDIKVPLELSESEFALQICNLPAVVTQGRDAQRFKVVYTAPYRHNGEDNCIRLQSNSYETDEVDAVGRVLGKRCEVFTNVDRTRSRRPVGFASLYNLVGGTYVGSLTDDDVPASFQASVLLR